MFVFQKLNSFFRYFFLRLWEEEGGTTEKGKKSQKKRNQFAHILPMHSMKSVYYLILFDFTI